MTDKEKAIVMAYTGISMLIGDKFDIFHEYVEKIMCRPVFSHEFATCAEEIKEKAKPDFLKLCAEEEPDRPHGEWHTTPNPNHSPFDSTSEVIYMCCICSYSSGERITSTWNFCPNCGADMRKKEGGEDNEM